MTSGPNPPHGAHLICPASRAFPSRMLPTLSPLRRRSRATRRLLTPLRRARSLPARTQIRNIQDKNSPPWVVPGGLFHARTDIPARRSDRKMRRLRRSQPALTNPRWWQNLGLEGGLRRNILISEPTARQGKTSGWQPARADVLQCRTPMIVPGCGLWRRSTEGLSEHRSDTVVL
jgi:hypothetical protein